MSPVAELIQNNPVVAILSAVAALITVLEFSTGVMRSATKTIKGRFNGWLNEIFECELAAIGPQVVANPPIVVSPLPSDATRRIKEWLHSYYNRFGEMAKYNHFAERVERQQNTDDLYRTAFAEYRLHPKWHAIAEGVDEWVTIGFHVLCKQHPRWENDGTLNQLYGALCKALRDSELNVPNGEQLGIELEATVANYRRQMY